MSRTRIAAALVTGLATVASTGLMAAGTSQAATTIPTKGSGVAVVARGSDSVGRLVRFGANGSQQHLARVGVNWSVEDVSEDGRRVLLVDRTGSVTKINIHDTATRKTTPVKGNWHFVRFTKPSGTGLILQGLPKTSGASFPTVRADLAGRAKVSFPGIGDVATQNPAGTLLVAHTARGVTVNSNATGKVVRVVPNPRGYKNCFPRHFRDATNFTAVCSPTSGSPNLTQVFSMSTSGGRPTPLTSGLRRTDGAKMGFVDSWTTPRGQVVELMVGCGARKTGLVSGRTAKVVDAGAPIRVQGSVVTVARADGCDPGTNTIANRNLATGKVTLLVGEGRNKGETLRSWALVDPMN
ncbi:hypothetical protein GCM10027030_01140 [Luteococcus sediminum]